MDQIFADMNFNAINAHLIVGSHPRDAGDIDGLYNQNRVRAIVNLQRSGEPDRGDIDAITQQCALVGNRIWYQRVPVSSVHNSLQHFQVELHTWTMYDVDVWLLWLECSYWVWWHIFRLVDIECQIEDESKESLRDNLAEAVGILNRAIQERATQPGETVYLHCCRGIGRSPTVAVAYLFWFTDMTVSFRFSTCIYAPCKCLSSADLLIVAVQLLILSLVFLNVI
jgi:hypothetical protein